MSLRPTKISTELQDYILENFSSEDTFLKELREEAFAQGMPEMCISPDQGQYMQVMIRAMHVKNMLEIGTLAGYSAVNFARALPEDGKLTTVEFNHNHYEFAKQKIKESGLEHKVEVIYADGVKFLEDYDSTEQFDFVFVDADKKSYSKYLDLATPLIKIGGTFAADNAFAFGHVLTTAPQRNPKKIKTIKAFNTYFKEHEQYSTCIVPVGDGMTLGVKLK